MKFNSNNLLVTGGAGFIGSNFINYFLDKYDDTNIINLDLLTYAGDLNNLKNVEKNSRYKFIHGDICDKKLLENIFLKNQIDGVINFAAETHVDNSIVNPDAFIKTNINGVFNLLNIAYRFWMSKPFNVKKNFKLAKFHQISTDEVYGSIDKGSFNEKSNYSPNSPYSASKASADMIIRSFNKTFGLNTSISISSNNFGPNQNAEKFIPKVINSIINNEPIIIYGDGMNVRDWIYVNNHCKAIDIIYNRSESGKIYNIGGENEITNLALVDIIYYVINNNIKKIKKLKFIKDRYGHDRRYSLNIQRIKNDFNWKTSSNFEEDLAKYIIQLINSHNKV